MATPPNAMTSFVDGLRVHASDMVPTVANINDIYNSQLNNGFFSRYTISGNIATGTMLAVTPVLAEGAGLGLTLSGNLFTLATGIWTASFSLRHAAPVTSNSFHVCISTDATNGDTGVIAQDGTSGTQTNAVWAQAVSTGIRSATGTTTLGFKVFWTGAPVAPVFSRITFMRDSSS
jgi:hypothetical protein